MRRVSVGLAFGLVLVVLYAAEAAQKQSAGANVAGPAANQINLNTATATQLESLPGIGAKTAQRIIEHRQKNGSFKKIEELMNIRGVGEKSFLKLRPLITVGPATTATPSAVKR
jgi:competence protein ComEA